MRLTEQGPGDYAIIAGRRTPGLIDVTGASSPRKWDERRGYGLTGSTVVFTGLGLGKFPLKFRLFGDPFIPDPDWQAWFAFEPVLSQPPTKLRNKGLDIWHPFLERLGIKSIVVEEPIAPVQTGEGEWTIEYKVIQFRKVKLTLVKTEGSKAEPVDPVEQNIIAPLRKELDAQLEELARS